MRVAVSMWLASLLEVISTAHAFDHALEAEKLSPEELSAANFGTSAIHKQPLEVGSLASRTSFPDTRETHDYMFMSYSARLHITSISSTHEKNADFQV